MITENSRRISAEEIRDQYFIEDAWRDEGFEGEPKKLCKSPFREDRKPSFSVFNDGRSFKDHASNEGGDVVQFVMLANQCTFREALEIIASRIGYQRQKWSLTRKTRVRTRKSNRKPLQSIPPELLHVWNEGIRYLQNQPKQMEDVNLWRGWEKGTSEDLCESGLISLPMIRGNRVLSFVVHKIYKGNELICGFHSYYGKHNPNHPAWQFYPNTRLHKQSVSPLPFVIGGGYLTTARLIVITEGQWDAISFAVNAGWFGDPSNYPENVCIFGIRGAGNWRQLLEHYKFPESASILVIPDCDEAGLKWENTLVPELRKRSAKVRWVPPVEGDFSDFCKSFKGNVRDSIYKLLKGL